MFANYYFNEKATELAARNFLADFTVGEFNLSGQNLGTILRILLGVSV